MLGGDTARLSPLVAPAAGAPWARNCGSSLQLVCLPVTPSSSSRLTVRPPWPLAASRRPVQAVRPPPDVCPVLGSCAQGWQQEVSVGLKGSSPAAAGRGFIGLGSARLRPQTWGGQDPHPFRPVLRQMGQGLHT